jgi:NAD(P)-dependent dehydrogenase (short-subunit alcohol dehydrogenase family)
MHNQDSLAPITKDAVWFITGCSTGFGRELAKQLLAQGSSVAVTARDPSSLRAHPKIVALIDEAFVTLRCAGWIV